MLFKRERFTTVQPRACAVIREGPSVIIRKTASWMGDQRHSERAFKQFLEDVEERRENAVKETVNGNPTLAIKKDKFGETALHKAARNNDEQLGRLLIETNSNCLNEASKTGYMPIHLSVEGNKPEFTQLLLQKNAERECVINDGRLTPLHLAAKNRSIECLSVLLQANCRTDKPSRTGKVALHFAAIACDVRMIEALVERECNQNKVDNEGFSALHFAVQHGTNEDLERCIETVEFLISHEVAINPLLKNRFEETAEDLAVKNGNRQAANLIRAYSRKYEKWENQLRETLPQSKIKVFFCGERGAGKTTLLSSLDTTFFQRMFRRRGDTRRDPGHDAVPSLGVQIQDLRLPNGALFNAWDLGGDMRSNVTIEYVMSGVDALFVVLVNLEESDDSQKKQLIYWLSIVRTCSFADVTCIPGSDGASAVRRPRVVVGLTHADGLDQFARDRGIINAREVAATFKAYLDVDDVVCLNCVDSAGQNVADLKRLMGRHYRDIIERLPKVSDVCTQVSDQIEKKLKEGQIQPIIRLNDLWALVRRNVNPLVPAKDDHIMKKILTVLSGTGRVVYTRWSHPASSWVAVDPSWLCNGLFKPLFVTESRQQSIWRGNDAAKGFVTREDLKNRYPRFQQDVLIEVLMAYRLCTRHLRFPSLIQRSCKMDETVWRPSDDLQLYTGRRFCCKSNQDVLLPGFFPKLQVKALTERALHVWHGGFVVAMQADRSVQALVELDPVRRMYVDVVVRGPDGAADRCLSHLVRIQRWVLDICAQSSPVTALTTGVVSVNDLRGHVPPDQRIAYPLEQVIDAEESGKAVNYASDDGERVLERPVDLLYCGNAGLSEMAKGLQRQCAFLSRNVTDKVEHLLQGTTASERRGSFGEVPWVKLANELGLGHMVGVFNLSPATAVENVLHWWASRPQCLAKALVKGLIKIGRADASKVITDGVEVEQDT